MSEEDDDICVPEPGEAGRAVKYHYKGEDIEIRCFPLTDGFLWEFERKGNVIPLRLSRVAMQSMFRIYSDMIFMHAYKIKEEKPESETEVSKE